MDGLWLSDKILRIIRDKKQKTTDFVMQGSTTERADYNFMIGQYRILEEIEDEKYMEQENLNTWTLIILTAILLKNYLVPLVGGF